MTSDIGRRHEHVKSVNPVSLFSMFYDVFPILRTLPARERLALQATWVLQLIHKSPKNTPGTYTRPIPHPAQPPPLPALTAPHQCTPTLNRPGARRGETEETLHRSLPGFPQPARPAQPRTCPPSPQRPGPMLSPFPLLPCDPALLRLHMALHDVHDLLLGTL